MKRKPLSLSLQAHSLSLKIGTELFITITNQTCHYLLNSKHLQNEVYASLDGDAILVIGCGATNIPEKFTTLRVSDFHSLLDTLTRLLQGKEFTQNVLNTLIIDNLLIFYWDLKVLNESNYHSFGFSSYVAAKILYLRLMDLIQSIRIKYRCNVLVCSFDVDFENGYKSNWRGRNSEGLDKYSYLPSGYLLKHDFLVHIGDEWEVFDKKWVRTEILSLEESGNRSEVS